MTDYQPVQESELETGEPPPAGLTGDGVGGLSKNTYQPVNEDELAPIKGFGAQLGGARGPGIPSAVAERFKPAAALERIFDAGAKKAWAGYSNSFADLTAQDQQDMVDAGYKPGDFRSVGGALRWGRNFVTAAADTVADGFLALGPAVSEFGAGAEGQFARETGATEEQAQSAEREGGFWATGALMAVGLEGPPAPTEAAAAAFERAQRIARVQDQAAVGGIYSHAYRVDPTPGGGLVNVPLGRLPDGAEAAQQAKVAADALHLPPSAADTIARTYTETGRPPAEVLLDAKTNNGGVLSDIIAGRTPTVYLGAKAETLPVLDTAEIGRLGREATLNEQDAKLVQQLDALPAGDLSAQDRLNRLAAVDDQLKAENLEPQQRRALQDRRDQILVDTNPEALKAAAQPLIERRNLEAQRQRVAEQLGDIERERRAAQTETALSPVPKTEQAVSPVGAPSSAVPAAEPSPQSIEPPTAQAPEVTKAADAGTQEPSVTAPEKTQALKATPAPVLKERLPDEPGVSRVGKSIASRALEAKLIDALPETAKYDTITLKDLADRVSSLINEDPDKAIAMLRGDEPLPADLQGPAQKQAFVNGMELWMHANKRGDLAGTLANSPLIRVSSEAGQTLRVARERSDQSPAAIFQDLQRSIEKSGNKKVFAERRAAVKEALPETEGVLLPKEQQSWERFLEAIKC